MSSILDALGYVGDALSKPGRAVRGLLGGRPEELAAAIPFSDSLGLSDPSQAVTGHDLLSQMGFDPGDGLGGTLAGIGVDVATDPLTYFGGALARGAMRGLGRGGAAIAEHAGPESHIFDLVSPEERAASEALGQGIERAFPVPTTGSRLEAAGLRPADLAGEEAALKGRTDLLDSLTGAEGHPIFGEVEPHRAQIDTLSQMREPRDWGFSLGIGPDNQYNPAQHGFSADMIADNLKMDALRLQLPHWDEAIQKLSSLPDTPLTFMRSGPSRSFESEIPEVAAAHRWSDVLMQRASDLRGLGRLGEAIPNFEQIAPQVSKQYDAIRGLLGSMTDVTERTSLGSIAGDLTRGDVPPSMIPGLLGTRSGGRILAPHLSTIADYGGRVGEHGESIGSGIGVIGHLPFDESLLRRLAAQQQAAEMERKIGSILEEYQHYPLSSSARLDPNAISKGFEPNIARQVMQRPDIQERIAEARRLYGQHTPQEMLGHFDVPLPHAVEEGMLNPIWDEALMGPMPPAHDPFWQQGGDAINIDDILGLPPR